MAEQSKGRGSIKFLVWSVIAVGLVYYWATSYTSGQMVNWYYYTAKTDGYAVNAAVLDKATKDNPVVLEVGKFDKLEGLKAVKIKKGDQLPLNCNGVIDDKTLKEGKRAVIEGNNLKVMIPSQIKESKGFKYRDTFKHKGVKTNPWSGAWNAAMVIFLGLALGYMAEGFTDLLGIRLKKIEHYGH